LPRNPGWFDEEFLRRLEGLRLACRRPGASEPEGPVLTRRRGQSIEFQSHRGYVPGDEFRHIDWNLAGRLDGLFVKQFAREQGRRVYLVVDDTASMGFGAPSKLAAAARAAAALGMLALAGAAVVRICPVRDRPAGASVFRGDASFGAMLGALDRLAAAGTASLARALQAARRELDGPSTVILLSDLWDDAGVEEAIRDLAGLQCELAVLRILAPEEIDPVLAGKRLLVDSETGRRHRLYIGEEERATYRAQLAQDDARWKAVCARHHAPFLRVSSAVPVTEVVLVLMREAGVVQ